VFKFVHYDLTWTAGPEHSWLPDILALNVRQTWNIPYS